MFDGFKCKVLYDNERVGFSENPLLNFILQVSDATGEVMPRKVAKRDGLTFAVNGDSSLLYGSLHKYKNVPHCHNWDRFTFQELQAVLCRLNEVYGVDLAGSTLQTLEIGVNIPVRFAPERYFNMAVCHNGKPFDSLDKRNRKLGIVCKHSDYTVKLYDKGKQARVNGVSTYIMRVEIKLHSSKVLKELGVASFSKLQNVEIVALFFNVLADKLKGLVFFDRKEVEMLGLSEVKRNKLERFGNPKYWEELNKNQAYKARKQLDNIRVRYNLENHLNTIMGLVAREFGACIGVSFNGNVYELQPEIWKDKQIKQATISTLEYLLEKVALGGLLNDHKRPKKTRKKQTVVMNRKQKERKQTKPTVKTDRRFCVSCGREITHLKNTARFCSERERGRDAKQCRNRDSNARASLKRKINRAMEQEKYLQITYRDKDGIIYTDILGEKEIGITREWLDSIVEVEVLGGREQVKLSGNDAQNFLAPYRVDVDNDNTN